MVLLLWIYYSSIILFLGAELTQAYAKCCGHEIVPNESAEWDPETAQRLRQKQEEAQLVHSEAGPSVSDRTTHPQIFASRTM